MNILITISTPTILSHTENGQIILAPGRYEARPLPNAETSRYWALYDSSGIFVGNAAIEVSQNAAKLG